MSQVILSDSDRIVLLKDLESRLDAAAPNAYAFTLFPCDLAAIGIPTAHKRRRYIAWIRRHIEAERQRIVLRIANKLTA
jgi:hypothetical protein